MSHVTHRLLRRQLQRYLGGQIPADGPLGAFIDAVERAYREADSDRELTERSLDITSRELLERNDALTQAMVRERSRSDAIARQNRVLVKLAHIVVDAWRDHDSAARRITEEVAEMLGVERTSVWLLDDGDTLRCLDRFELASGVHGGGPVITAADAPEYFEALRGSRLWVADDVHRRDTARGKGEPAAASILDAAVRVDGKLVGIVRCEHVGVPRPWTPEDQAFVGSVADALSLIIEGTRRRQAEEALEQQRAFLRQIIDLNPNLIFAKDRAGRYTLVNQALAEVHGITVEDLIGKTDHDVHLNLDEVEQFRATDDEILSSGAERFIPELRMTDHQGRVRWLQAVKRPISDRHGAVDQILGVATDITERKRAEEERAALEDSLRHAQKMESIGLLAGGVAHDFNNLLTPILAYADMALSAGLSGSLLQDALRNIVTAAEGARELTAHLLALGRKQVLQLRTLNLNEEIEKTTRLLSRMIPENIAFVLELDPRLDAVRVDDGQFQQVLVNLAINARDAMPSGGTLTIATCNVTTLESGRSVRQVAVRVRDTGIGMDEATRRKIFEPFFTTKELGRGTGLGLAMVYGIVKQHGATIEVESTLGAGSTFELRFLSTESAPQPITPDRPALGPRGQGETVLVVEDQALVRGLVEMALRRHGYQVLVAADPDEALRCAAAHTGPIELLLTDLVLPRMNGKELYAELVATRPICGVLYMSGYSHDVLGPRGLLDEGMFLLRKPFSTADLTSTVRRVIDQNARAAW